MKARLNLRRNAFILIVLACSLLLIFPVVSLMTYVQTLLNTDIKVNLSEIVTQNKNVITSKINVELDNLSIMATQVVDDMKKQDDFSITSLKAVYKNYIGAHAMKQVFIADDKGNAYFPDNTQLNIAGRQYYRLSMDNKQNISDMLISRKDGVEVFIFSVPIYYEGKAIGTLQRSYTQKEMTDLFALSLYSSDGFIHVIDSEGYILFHSEHKECTKRSDNYFRDLYEYGNVDMSKEVSNNIHKAKSGFMEIKMNGDNYFSSYTAMDKIYGWYIISSVKASAVSYNSDIVVKIFYVILLILVLIFALIACVFWIYKNRQQEVLRKVAFVDSVTKGNTYNKFIVDVKAALHANLDKKYFILKFDIDNFKYINKYYGFDTGDKILQNITENFQKQLSPSEILARNYGDNFIALLENADEERIRTLLDQVKIQGDILIYYSSGVYEIIDPTENISIMVDKASMASNAIKGNMRNKISYYTKDFELQNKHDEELKRDIKKALEDTEFVPFFQPKVDINTKEIIGAEALARWNRKGVGIVSPFVFVPICEKSGMIVELDMMIFEKTLQFLKECLAEGVKCKPISINFSRAHLSDEHIIDKIVEKLEVYKVPPNLIEIELTESDFFENLDVILDFTDQLHKHGLSLAMDDFGSGYSSLNMLKDIPIDILKVDKEFLSDTKNASRRKVIFKSMVDMVHNLDINIIVEGVETEENITLMKECGCPNAQGYYYSKPISEEDFRKLYKEGKVA